MNIEYLIQRMSDDLVQLRNVSAQIPLAGQDSEDARIVTTTRQLGEDVDYICRDLENMLDQLKGKID